MISLGIKLTGDKELARRLKDIPAELRREILGVLTTATLLVQRDAIKGAPADSGLLRQSIKTEVDQEALRGYVYVDPRTAPHGQTVEDGRTPGAAGPPYGRGGTINRRLEQWARRHGGSISRPGDLYALTRHIHDVGLKAKPYLGPAFQKNERVILELFEKAIEKVLER